jgi:hypothetical protein
MSDQFQKLPFRVQSAIALAIFESLGPDAQRGSKSGNPHDQAARALLKEIIEQKSLGAGRSKRLKALPARDQAIAAHYLQALVELLEDHGEKSTKRVAESTETPGVLQVL